MKYQKTYKLVEKFLLEKLDQLKERRIYGNYDLYYYNNYFGMHVFFKNRDGVNFVDISLSDESKGMYYEKFNEYSFYFDDKGSPHFDSKKGKGEHRTLFNKRLIEEINRG